MTRKLITFFVAFATLPSAYAAPAAERPPQFVALAFDGSQSLSFWQASRDFAKGLREQGTPFGFTYFISGVYYLGAANRKHYQGPGRVAGASDIGFGGDANDLLARAAQTNAAFTEGNEIGSHANGHFDGSKWTAQQWSLEFALFDDLIFGMFTNNALRPAPDQAQALAFTEKDVVGFRAPLLGVSAGLWPTLKEHAYRYDTSRVASTGYWPEKKPEGYWNFPLASVRIAGSGKATLSMDYNFYVAQSAAKPDPANSALYEKQMYETYMRYFESNYDGNRAPVNIGHHFSQWNGGAYWRAMQAFAKTVCGKPEVRCVTYRELADYMDTLTPEQLAAYRKGEFPKLPAAKIAYDLPAPHDFDLREALGRVSGGKTEKGAAASSEGFELTPADLQALGLEADSPAAHAPENQE